jgi:3-methylfumaryl-CoA hydratase
VIDANAYNAWLGRREECTDIIAAAPLKRLLALLDRPPWPWESAWMPPLGHWLFHLAATPQSALGIDGHALRGTFLPPIPLSRRMWAGSRITVHRPIALGTAVVRISTIAQIKVRPERGGTVFVTVHDDFAADGEILMTEERDIVYLGDAHSAPRPSGSTTGQAAEAVRRFTADPVILFRYSALTFNSHRIHYDRDYATVVEKYPGLVVHGPLIATLLMDHFLRIEPTCRITTLSCRARAPAFDAAPFDLCMKRTESQVELWAQTATGTILMTVSLALAQPRG